MDVPQSPKDLTEVFEVRKDHHFARLAAMDVIERAVFGKLPQQYEELFAEGEVKLEVRTIRTADDDLTALTAKVFPILVNPLGKRDSETSRKSAERVEKIAYGWNDGSASRTGPEMDAIMHQLARHQVRFGDGCLGVFPDYEKKLLFFEVFDPRMHLPPVGWTPWGQTPLDHTLLVSEMTLGEVKARYARDDDTIRMRLDNEYPGPAFGKSAGDRTKVKVGQYYCREYWYVATLSTNPVVLMESSYGDYGHPGVCPITAFTQFASEPLFMGQVGIEAAMMKVLNQEIQGTQQMLTGPIFGPKVVGDKVDWTGYNVVDDSLGKQPPPQRLAPTSPLGLERTFRSLFDIASRFNRNPESFQGAGDANSAKAVQTLQSGIRSTVQDILWAPFKTGFPRVYDNCLEMELNLWPNDRKTSSGKKGNQTFEVDYTPITHLQGYKGRIKIEPGFGLGGYQQTLEAMQLVQSELMPEDMFYELYPGYRDAGDVKQRMAIQKVDKLMFAVAEAKGPTLTLSGLAEVRKRVESGTTLGEAFREVSDAGMLEAQPEMPGAEGIPPELAAMMGGPEQGAPMSLADARGF